MMQVSATIWVRRNDRFSRSARLTFYNAHEDTDQVRSSVTVASLTAER